LQGVDDGTTRIRLGVLHVTNAGALITFTAETNSSTYDPTVWYRQHLNEAGQTIDFGDVRTDGSAWLRHEGNVWVLKTWPRSRAFTLELNSDRFDAPARVSSPGGSTGEVMPVATGSHWRIPLNGAREYRWTNDGVRACSPVPTGSVWKYLDNGSDQGTAWRSNSFNDSTWKSGPAELGYGDGGENTTVNGGPSNNHYITTYFRRSFLVPDASRVLSLTARLLRDDGAVAYLNGTEIWRDGLPANTNITYRTLATQTISGTDETNFISKSLSPSLLLDGTNLLAVEIHQTATNSSDISFDFELATTAVIPVRPALAVSQESGALALTGPVDAGFFQVYAATNISPPVAWTRATNTPFLTSSQWTLMLPSATNTSRFFRLQAQ
jgi:hypothetical protein